MFMVSGLLQLEGLGCKPRVYGSLSGLFKDHGFLGSRASGAYPKPETQDPKP